MSNPVYPRRCVSVKPATGTHGISSLYSAGKVPPTSKRQRPCGSINAAVRGICERNSYGEWLMKWAVLVAILGATVMSFTGCQQRVEVTGRPVALENAPSIAPYVTNSAGEVSENPAAIYKPEEYSHIGFQRHSRVFAMPDAPLSTQIINRVWVDEKGAGPIR